MDGCRHIGAGRLDPSHEKCPHIKQDKTDRLRRGGKEPVYYHSYLQLDQLLSSTRLLSAPANCDDATLAEQNLQKIARERKKAPVLGKMLHELITGRSPLHGLSEGCRGTVPAANRHTYAPAGARSGGSGPHSHRTAAAGAGGPGLECQGAADAAAAGLCGA